MAGYGRTPYGIGPWGGSDSLIQSIQLPSYLIASVFSANYVYVIDVTSNIITDIIYVKKTPYDIISGENVFAVVNRNDDTISFINSNSLIVTNTVNVGKLPKAIAFGASYFAVINSDNTISFISTSTWSIIKTISLNGSFINFGNNNFAVINTKGSNTYISFINATSFSMITKLLPTNNIGGICYNQDSNYFAISTFNNNIGSIIIIDATNFNIVNTINTSHNGGRIIYGDGYLAVVRSPSGIVDFYNSITFSLIKNINIYPSNAGVGNSYFITYNRIFALTSLNMISLFDVITGIQTNLNLVNAGDISGVAIS